MVFSLLLYLHYSLTLEDSRRRNTGILGDGAEGGLRIDNDIVSLRIIGAVIRGTGWNRGGRSPAGALTGGHGQIGEIDTILLSRRDHPGRISGGDDAI